MFKDKCGKKKRIFNWNFKTEKLDLQLTIILIGSLGLSLLRFLGDFCLSICILSFLLSEAEFHYRKNNNNKQTNKQTINFIAHSKELLENTTKKNINPYGVMRNGRGLNPGLLHFSG